MIGSRCLVRCFALLLIISPMINQCQSRKKPLNCNRHPEKCVKTYRKILRRLVEEVPSDNVKRNMDKIFEWIKVHETTGDENKELSNSEFTELSALNLIHSLIQIDNKGVCKLSTAKSLEKNDAALENAIARLPYGSEPRTRLEKIVKDYVDKFLENCDYRPRLEEFMKFCESQTSKLPKCFDYLKLESMKNVIGEVIGTQARRGYGDPKAFVHDEPIPASAFAEKHLKSFDGPETALIFVRFLSDELTKNKVAPTKPLSNEPYVRDLLEEYLFKICESYVERLDSVFSNKWTLAQSVKYNKMTVKIAGVHKHLAYFHGCKKVLFNKLAISRAIADYENEVLALDEEFM